MSNKEWDKISYNQSYDAEMEIVQHAWDALIKEHPIEESRFQPICDVNIKANGTDVY